MKWVNRASWGARYGRGPTNITPERGGVAIHWEGPRMGSFPHSACDDKVRGIERYHVERNGWAAIAYTLLVCPHGYVFEGRGVGHRTAANGTNDSNQRYYAVCALIGQGDPTPDALLAGMADAVAYLRSKDAGGALKPHSHFFATACPGDRLRAWIRDFDDGPSTPSPRPSPTPAPNWMEAAVKRLPTLRRGDSGEHVQTMQALLRARSHPEVTIDGDFGPVTEAALKAVQRWGGVAADGICGPKTWPVALRVHR